MGERRIVPRIVGMLPYLKFRFGCAKVQFVGLSNVVQAHVKGVEKLNTDPELIGGEAYFISDGQAMSQWDYLQPLITG